MNAFNQIFQTPKPVIAVLHLLPLPGSHRYQGNMSPVYETALQEAEIFAQAGVHGLIIENFRDAPFYPETVPSETLAAMAAVTREIVRQVDLPIGVNTLRNDAPASIAIAVAAQAQFIRVNVHLGAVIADQGLIQGNAHHSLRLRSQLKSDVLIFADVGVKHAAPLAYRGLGAEAKELTERGCVDALIVSGAFTGAPTKTEDLQAVLAETHLPVLIGSGMTPENLGNIYPLIQGMIVGSTFKQAGQADNPVDLARVQKFMAALANC